MFMFFNYFFYLFYFSVFRITVSTYISCSNYIGLRSCQIISVSYNYNIDDSQIVFFSNDKGNYRFINIPNTNSFISNCELLQGDTKVMVMSQNFHQNFQCSISFIGCNCIKENYILNKNGNCFIKEYEKYNELISPLAIVSAVNMVMTIAISGHAIYQFVTGNTINPSEIAIFSDYSGYDAGFNVDKTGCYCVGYTVNCGLFPGTKLVNFGNDNIYRDIYDLYGHGNNYETDGCYFYWGERVIIRSDNARVVQGCNMSAYIKDCKCSSINSCRWWKLELF